MSRRRDQPGPTPLPGGLAYRYDDGGRADAGVPGKGHDHLVRAIAVVTGGDYRAVRKAMAKAMGEHGYTLTGKESARWRGGVRPRPRRARRDVEEMVLRQFGCERVAIPPRSPRPTLAEAYGQYGDCIVEITGRRTAMARYMCALVGGALRDIRDVRTYRWGGAAIAEGYRPSEIRPRKALNVWLRG